jgi:hypothetical protein
MKPTTARASKKVTIERREKRKEGTKVIRKTYGKEKIKLK